MTKHTTVGGYLVTRLEQFGLKHIFGVPGDYVLGFYDQLVDSDIHVVGTCTEIGAGYAADAYARVHGLGAVCITYCVGGLNLINAVAGAYAERSPLIVISGAPGVGERARSPLLHHQVRDFQTQLRIYENVTDAAIAIENAEDAPRLIDSALQACFRDKHPIYIELPRDVVELPCPAPGKLELHKPASDPDVLAEMLAEASAMLNAAKRPAILAGVEVHRFGLQNQLVKLADETGYPVAATLLGKSVMSEQHPQYLGVYEGAMGREHVRRRIENADCLLALGAILTDINLGIGTAKLDPDRTIKINARQTTIRHHRYDDVSLGDALAGLNQAPLRKTSANATPASHEPAAYHAKADTPVTVKRFIQKMNAYLDDQDVIIADTGDSLFASADLMIHRRTEFISQAFYASMGFGVPAALGAQIGNRKLRPIVLVGDGAFQMTGHELSTIARHALNPIICVFDNQGYTTERVIHEGPYNDVRVWAYHLWPQLVQDGWGARVTSEEELDDALARARRNTDCFSILNIQLGKLDCSDALTRLGEQLAHKIGPSRNGDAAAKRTTHRPARRTPRKHATAAGR